MKRKITFISHHNNLRILKMMSTDFGISLRNFSARLMLFFTSIVLLTACSSSKKEESTLERFRVTSPLIEDTVYIKEYVADIQSIQNVEIRAKASGYLESIHADEGQYVKAGQLLFSISGSQYRLELLKAQASLTWVVDGDDNDNPGNHETFSSR
jgi:multidrug efflux pump subunit AcrA (membrane-fusion protein)